MEPIAVRQAESGGDVAEVKTLFLEYASSLGFSLCFQGFDAELAGLPGAYAAPKGRLYLAVDGAGRAIGCVGLRPLADGFCEMKRLYVRPEARGHGLARRLVDVLLRDARELGYTAMRLDTLPVMREAIAFYRTLGFREIAPYTHNPVEGALFMELPL
jgi:ribosomal protein S18 acetylase RimI-like enzyme